MRCVQFKKIIQHLLLCTSFALVSLYSDNAIWTGNADPNFGWTNNGNWNPNDTFPNGTDDVATFNGFPGDVYSYLGSSIEVGSLINNTPTLVSINGNEKRYSVTINNTIESIDTGNVEIVSTNKVYATDGLDIDFSGADTSSNSFSLSYAGTFSSPDNGSISFIGAGIFDIGNTTVVLNELALSNGAKLTIRPTDQNPFNVTQVSMARANDAVIFNGPETYELTTNITGVGGFENISTSPLTLSGINTYSGQTENLDPAATLTGTTTSIPSQGGFSNGGTLIFNQNFDGEYTGVISGVGTLQKLGTGTLTLSNLNSYTGGTFVDAGVLSITETGSIDSSRSVVVTATLKGSGSVSDLNNNGTVQAGSAAGESLIVTENYVQSPDATLKSLISPTSASYLDITGTAVLGGTLELDIETGVYTDGTSYVVVDAGGGLGGTTFDTLVETHSGNWSLSYNATQAIVSVSGNSIVTPVSASELSGTDLSLFNYMFADPNFVTSNSDLNAVADSMLALPAEEFKEALVAVTPLASNAIPFSGFQNNLQMAIVLDNEFQAIMNNELLADSELSNTEKHEIDGYITSSYNHSNKKTKGKSRSKKRSKSSLLAPELYYDIPKTGLFVEPIFLAYHQNDTQGLLQNQGQVGFDSYTYGAGLGWEQILKGKWVLEGGIGYTHSNLNWNQNFGNARWSTIYIAPFFGYFNDTYYANAMVMGAFDFIHNERRIQFTGVERIAKSNYHNYNVLVRLNGGYRYAFPKSFWLQPDLTLNYLTTFTESYKESGANSINLDVKSTTNYILQPSFRLKLIKQFYSRDICFAPNIYMGWLSNILLKTQSASARFLSAPNQTFFNISGYYKTNNQMVVGGEYYMEKEDTFIASSSFEADLLSQLQVYIVKLKFQWIF